MIQLFTSTDINTLTNKLAENVRNNNEIFIPDFILVNDYGIKNWVKNQLATSNSIAANLRFENHQEMMNIIYKVLNDGNEQKVMSDNMFFWQIYRTLSSTSFQQKFKTVYDYYEGDVIKQLGLTQKLVKLFNKYEEYLSDDKFAEIDSIGFQNYIITTIRNENQNLLTKKAIKHNVKALIEDIGKKDNLESKFKNIHVFLNFEMSSFYLDFYAHLGEITKLNINFYGIKSLKKESINPLNKSYGAMSSKILKPEVAEEILEVERNNNDTSTLLKSIQYDLHTDTTDSFGLKDTDDSIVINSCYSKVREVEVLANYLIKTILQNEDKIGYKDILVQAVNIDEYAPAIKAVFSSLPHKMKMNFSIADRTFSFTDSIFNSILAILEMDKNLPASKVIELLDFSAIRDNYGISDINKVIFVINEANIRFGITEKSENEIETVSWFTGLKKVIYGFCLGRSDKVEIEQRNLYLKDLVEGTEINNFIGLYQLILDIEKWTANYENSNNLQDWNTIVQSAIDTFIQSDNYQELSLLKKKIGELSEITEYVKDKVDYFVFKGFVVNVIENLAVQSNFSSGGITFSSLVQNRNVPFKVICLLGMNYDAFPRKETLLSYDLLKDASDVIPTSKEKDKFLFLQTLKSAEQNLFISYIGRDINNNSKRPPSSVVDDLEDYILSKVNKDKFIIEHPLHGFSEKYNLEDGKNQLYTYLVAPHSTKKARENKYTYKSDEDEKNDKEKNKEEIPLNKFINFFKDPFKHYYNNRLGIYYSDETPLLEDYEITHVEYGLPEWKFKSELLNYSVSDLLDQDVVKNIGERFKSDGELPLSNYGNIILKELIQKISPIKTTIEGIVNTEKKNIKINHPVGDYNIIGDIDGVYGNTFVYCCLSSTTEGLKHALEFHIKSYLLKEMNIGVNNFIYINSKGKVNRSFNINSEINPIEKLLKIYNDNQQNIFPFIGDFKFEVYRDILNFKDDEEKGSKTSQVYKKLESIINNDNNFISEYLKKEFNNSFFDLDDSKIDEFLINSQCIVNKTLKITLPE
jgi:exodeoxyribonuclease V gamma subunit